MEDRRLKVTYEEHGDIKTEDIDKYGDIIYKQDDCEYQHSYDEHEYWLHKPSNKIISVPISIKRNWGLACPEE
jgi:hypothetical protein